MFKIPRPAYTVEFKALAVKRVKAGEGIAKVSRELGLEKQCQSVTYKTVSAPEWCANCV